jgi:hypothetical protein
MKSVKDTTIYQTWSDLLNQQEQKLVLQNIISKTWSINQNIFITDIATYVGDLAWYQCLNYTYDMMLWCDVEAHINM